jgi:hypothetical protein
MELPSQIATDSALRAKQAPGPNFTLPRDKIFSAAKLVTETRLKRY